MSENKKAKYRGFTPAQAEAHKRYMKDFVEIKVRMKAEKRSIVQEHAASMGESATAFINRAIDESMSRDAQTPTETTDQATPNPVFLLPPEALEEAQAAVRLTGEAVPDFVTRAVKAQAKRDGAARRMGLNPVTGEILKAARKQEAFTEHAPEDTAQELETP